MNRCLPLFVILFCIFSTQTVSAQTTLEEYNYVVKGYKTQIESGLDMKKGYVLTDITQVNSKQFNPAGEERKAWLKALYKELPSGGKKIAAYMIIYQKTGSDQYFICVPHPDSDKTIADQFWQRIYDGDTRQSQEFRLQLITYLLSRQMKW